MSKTWAGGSTTAWRRVRASVLARDASRGWGCRAHEERINGQNWCERGQATPHQCTGTPDVAHHTEGRARTGDDPRHIVAACTACNLAIGDPGARASDPPATPITRWK